MSRLFILSLTVATALAATICWEVRTLWEPDAGVGPPRSGLARADATLPKQKPADSADAWLASALERPLLRSTRRPDKTLGEAQSKSNEAPRLAGVITGPFGNRAIFAVPGNPKSFVAKEGSLVGTFVVGSIQPGRVIVESDGGSHTYRPVYAEQNQPPDPAKKRLIPGGG